MSEEEVPITRSRFLAWSLSSFWMKFGSRLYCWSRDRARRASSAVSSFWVEAARTNFSFLDKFFSGLVVEIEVMGVGLLTAVGKLKRS